MKDDFYMKQKKCELKNKAALKCFNYWHTVNKYLI